MIAIYGNFNKRCVDKASMSMYNNFCVREIQL